MIDEKKCKELPKATAKRLPLYLRYLKILGGSGVSRIKSKEFSEVTQVPSATIRRDFSHLGELGRSGYGYDVPYLIEVFNSILNTQEEKRIALVGYGNLGRALVNNNFRRNDNLKIVCVFDNNPELIGKTFDGFEIHSMDEFERVSKEQEVAVAITTVPSQYSQSAVDVIVQSGITAILNFAPDRVVVPKEVHVQYIDLTTELQTLIYFDENLIKS
ncbi:redox-sensing transcriptional repressor rex 2 [Enterococcus phoeniculicola]|jgi:redox-sensing transcriptional repressor|uniref:Redox-sensing transcriptional repressor Rex n=1 Tax=Enterococcus phoeniculicola ATCC BAA-412 TaxID=1158610 RepID=R3WLM5_9ENTE|nr:redox-sensing transcriptional repressor Rex [Enterococcus phoeniculicola]EOL48751.1 redox-sensing transcriptional repressor rex 2 [Enterococcus phoeniculicola ATCC BAA-412]EOT72597.1 redox-sensing transcriptional repressor rex 2 [Enterococcus phoeniculicola ATCC BAA-412]OJG71871.1 redox-sensing transcriptional repressor rex 2 [Enterococcus phoeniculicola]